MCKSAVDRSRTARFSPGSLLHRHVSSRTKTGRNPSPPFRRPKSRKPNRKDGSADLKSRISALDFLLTGEERKTAYAGRQDGRNNRTGEDTPDGKGYPQGSFFLLRIGDLRRKQTSKKEEDSALQNRSVLLPETERRRLQNPGSPGQTLSRRCAFLRRRGKTCASGRGV